jgi:hypothetical protein
MGDRATITIYQDGCYPDKPLNLYTHWEGASICQTLAEGLRKARNGGRLNDAPYATRIIFDTMTHLSGESTGFGIIVGKHDDINYTSPSVIWGGDEPTVLYGELEMKASAFIDVFAPDKSDGVVVVV